MSFRKFIKALTGLVTVEAERRSLMLRDERAAAKKAKREKRSRQGNAQEAAPSAPTSTPPSVPLGTLFGAPPAGPFDGKASESPFGDLEKSVNDFGKAVEEHVDSMTGRLPGEPDPNYKAKQGDVPGLFGGTQPAAPPLPPDEVTRRIREILGAFSNVQWEINVEEGGAVSVAAPSGRQESTTQDAVLLSEALGLPTAVPSLRIRLGQVAGVLGQGELNVFMLRKKLETEEAERLKVAENAYRENRVLQDQQARAAAEAKSAEARTMQETLDTDVDSATMGKAYAAPV